MSEEVKERWVWTVALAVHLSYLLSLRTGWLAPHFSDATHLYGPGCDFFALYQAGAAALQGQSLYTYVPGHTVVPYAYPFRYLPVVAYFPATMFTLAPPATAYAAWVAINELCLVQNVLGTYHRSGGGRRGALLGAVWLTFSPVFVHLWLGQFTFLLGSLLFWCILRLEEGDWKRAQGLWIASLLWKPASLLWAPIWLRQRRYWPGLASAAGLLLLNGAYFYRFPADWAVFAEANLRSLPLWVASNIGLSALIYAFTGPGATFGPIRLLLSILLVAPALWLTLWPIKATGSMDPTSSPQNSNTSAVAAGVVPVWLLGALWTVLFFLIYKEVWEQHLVLLLPFLVLALWRSPSPWLIILVTLLALPAPFVFYDVHGLGIGVDPQPYLSPRASFLHHSWRVAPLLGLYALWLQQAWKLRR